MDKARLAGAATLAWVALAAAIVITLRLGAPNAARWWLVGMIGVLFALFALAASLLLRTPARVAVPLLVVGGIVLQALALTAPPRMTDDYLRYAWDGRVQAAGIDPYRYPPPAPELVRLRDRWLFPDDRPRLNHPDVHTIYPPVAEAYFFGVHVLSPPGSRHKPWQAGAALLTVATTLALIRVLRAAGADPRLAVLWAWCPTVVLETGNNAHVDVLGALLVVLGLGALARRRGWLGGGLLGAAVAVKLLPALVFPAALRRRPLAVLSAAAGVFAFAYLPHLLAVGPGVIGYLPGYVAEEGYDGTGRFALLQLVLPTAGVTYAAAGLLALIAVLAWRRTAADRPWQAALVVTGTAFLVVGPRYPWYALLLVALVALDGRWEWLAVAAAGYPTYFAGALGLHHETVQAWAYGLALLIVAAVTLARARAGVGVGAGAAAPAASIGLTAEARTDGR